MRKWSGGSAFPYVERSSPYIFDDGTQWAYVGALEPTQTGYILPVMLSGSSYPTATISGAAISADAITKIDGTHRSFVGTATRLYEWDGTTGWTDVSEGGAAYTSGTEWHCAQYGNATIFTNYTDDVQVSTSGAFATLSGSPPKAKFAVAAANAVLLFNYNDGANTYQDGWWASDIGSHTTWTPGAGNEAANGRLLQSPGPITAAAKIGNDVIAFKGRSSYRLSYVGAPIYWQVQQISDSVGAYNASSVVPIAGVGLWIYDGQAFYLYDGNGFRQLVAGGGVSGGTASYGWYVDYTKKTAYMSLGSNNTHSYNWISDAIGTNLNRMVSGSWLGTAQLILCRSDNILNVFGNNTAEPYQKIVRISGSVSALYKADSAPTYDSSGGGAIYTGIFGSPNRKTTFKSVTPIMLDSEGTSATYQVLTVYYWNDVRGPIGTPSTITSLVGEDSSDHGFNFMLTCSYAMFRLEVFGDAEIIDLVVEHYPAGKN